MGCVPENRKSSFFNMTVTCRMDLSRDDWRNRLTFARVRVQLVEQFARFVASITPVAMRKHEPEREPGATPRNDYVRLYREEK